MYFFELPKCCLCQKPITKNVSYKVVYSKYIRYFDAYLNKKYYLCDDCLLYVKNYPKKLG